MILKSLYLNNFRNYDELEVNFHENLNVIYGNNGNGKTNLVEAIIYLSNLKSFRGVSDSNLIKFNKDNFVINKTSTFRSFFLSWFYRVDFGHNLIIKVFGVNYATTSNRS